MAEITATITSPFKGATLYFWEQVNEDDTAEEVSKLSEGVLKGAFVVTGTIGGATVVLEGSPDNTNWVTLADTAGDAISTTASDFTAEFVTSLPYVRGRASGGSSQDLDLFLFTRD